MAPMRALMTPAKRMERSISPDRPCVWLRCWLPAGLGAPADSREPASSTKAFTCAWLRRLKGQCQSPMSQELPNAHCIGATINMYCATSFGDARPSTCIRFYSDQGNEALQMQSTVSLHSTVSCITQSVEDAKQ